MEKDIATRLQEVEDRLLALELLTTQVAAFLPAPHVLLQHLTQDMEEDALFRAEPEERGKARILAMQQLMAIVLSARRHTALADARQIEQLLPEKKD